MKIGYKATYDMKCHNLTYEVGATYKCNQLVMHEKGFHYCDTPEDCLKYYDDNSNLKIIKIQDLSDRTIKNGEKYCSDHIKVLEVFGNYKSKNLKLDSLGRILRYENSDGYWETYEYDIYGNKVREEDSNGYWKNYEYDDHGNKIREENSNGYKMTYEYDEYGNVISKNDFKIEIIRG